ncbi:MAG: tyrosine--tRNA ligase [Candidatus Kapabacteria bacterium]|nr:tyrosine--tRNA ligase [Candidatus Kapabacteria bacterium]
MTFASLNEQLDIIKRGAAELLPEEELAKKIERSIATGKPMRIKLGCDPSRPDLHIGHAVVLNKLAEFQQLGHEVVFIIGDFTAMIGDPTGKSKTRPPLTLEETRINGQTYFEQAGKILDVASATVVYNSEWLDKLSFADVIRMTANYTVSQMLERDDFHKRFNTEQPISLHEFLYPLAQAMDSVHLKNDIEIGGTDQKFNFLVARELQRAYGIEPQIILTMPILEGTDGVEKMSKSLGNYIAITDSPREMFGKTMSIPDTLIARYAQHGAFATAAEAEAISNGLTDGSLHPRNAKVDVAKRIVARYHGIAAADAAFAEFERMFVKKDVPDEIEELTIDIASPAPVVDVIALTHLAPSKSEARRLIQGGGVSIDGERVTDIHATIDLTTQRLLKVGKRKFLKVKV